MRLCAVSVDLDEIPHYHALYGLQEARGAAAHAVYDTALPRLEALALAQDLKLTLFGIGADMSRAENAARLRAMSERGHEIANHTLDHLYDLTQREPSEMRRQVELGVTALAAATGQQPRGFRAPGYTVTDELFEVLTDCGVSWDSSVFPCPPYWVAKAIARTAIRLRGRRSRSILDTPSVLRAPSRPYRVGHPYWRPGSGLLELPIQVTRLTRLPYIGTTLTLAGSDRARWLTRQVLGEPLVNLELHGIDVLDSDDGLEALRPHQVDVRIPHSRKLEALTAALELLETEGYAFVSLSEAAERCSRGGRA